MTPRVRFAITNVFFVIVLVILLITQACKTKEKMQTTQRTAEDKLLEYKYTFVEAEKTKLMGDYNHAVELFSKCIQLNPQSDASYYELANLSILLTDYTNAQRLTEKAIQIDPANIWYQLLLAELYRKNNRISDALNIYEAVIEKNPQRVDLLYDLADFYTANGKFNQAINTYNKLENIYGVSEQTSFAKNYVFTKLNQLQKIEDELIKLSNAYPNEPKYRKLLADYYLENKRYDDAFKWYNELSIRNPEYNPVYLDLARYYQIKGNYPQSVKSLTTGFAATDIEIGVKMKYLLDLMGKDSSYMDSPEAFQLFDVLIKTHPDNPKVYLIYADLLMRMNKPTEAQKVFRQAINLQKNDLQLWQKLVFIDMEIKDFNSMFTDSYEAIGYFPNQPDFYLYNGIAAIQISQLDKAIKVLKDGKDLVVENPKLESEFYYYLGEAYEKSKNFTESGKAFEKSIELNQSNITCLNNYSYYLANRKSNLDRAKQLIERCLQTEPNKPSFLDTYAWILYRKGQFAEAKIVIEKAILNGGNANPLIMEHYGDILFMLNDKDGAKQQWQKAAQLGKGSDKLNEKIEKGTLIE